ncbi:MAG: DUF2207 domain-containing protein, partial [Erysipelotrichaceae bacterium]|nr:DUF2207 domain-containing protein [Erysipelotrichaceae bacterium]
MKPVMRTAKMFKSLSKSLHFGLVFLLLCTLGLSLFPSLSVQADQGGFTITDYHVESTLHEDNTLDVHETIQVNFTSSRHGIYRTIPERMYVGYTKEEREADPLGTLRPEGYSLIITDINVEGDDFRVKSEDRETTIRIGSSSESLIGPHTYDISYTIIFPQDYRDDCDFIFYSPLGAQWDTTIDSFSFTLNLDKGLTKKEMDQVNIYSGSMGNETNSLNVDYTVEKNRISGTASDIYPNEAVTVFARMHDGYFVGAEHVNPTPAWIVAMITAVLVAFVFLKERMTQSKTFTETVEFYPPENTSSAEVGYIVDGSAEVTDLMSLIPYWANKGILTIEDSGRNSFILHKQKELPADAHDYEQTVMRALFLEGDSVDIKDLGTNFARLMEAAQTQLKDAFTGDRKLSSWKTA